jgi:HAE1 family hydrophobic/amphiphilic exporter-1
VLAAPPAAAPGFSAQGGLPFQFNDLSNGGYSPTDLYNMAWRLIRKAMASGNFFDIYTQYLGDAPVWRIIADRDRMASLDINFGKTMQVLEVFNGGTFVN